MDVFPVCLLGNSVRLEALSLSHHSQLCAVGLDQALWELTVTQVRSTEDMLGYIRETLELQEKGTALPFAIVEKGTGSVVGCTRFGNIDRRNRRVEIGWTWVAKGWQRTAVNTETKYLLLAHAFEVLGCIRVEFKTDVLNLPSRNALVRIGAREEGTLRKHMVTDSGRVRDSVYYSIVDTEWQSVKTRLVPLLKR